MVFQAFVWSVCICFCLSLYVCVQMFVSVHKSVCLHVHGNVCTLNLCWVTTKMSLPWCPTPKCPETVMSLSFLSPTKMSLFMSLSFGHGGHWSLVIHIFGGENEKIFCHSSHWSLQSCRENVSFENVSFNKNSSEQHSFVLMFFDFCVLTCQPPDDKIKPSMATPEQRMLISLKLNESNRREGWI